MPQTTGISGLIARWVAWRARRLVKFGAVTLDTETTDWNGEIIEVAVVDARTDAVLIETLVRPMSPIAAEAVGVHGITETMVADAPAWTEVWPRVQAVVGRRPVVAYNAPFDRARVAADCSRHGLPAPRNRWKCLMRMDARQRRGRWRRLEGGHRATGDAIAAARLLRDMAKPMPPKRST